MKRLMSSVAVALGATTICCLWFVSPLISPTHSTIYHWSGKPSALFVPTIVDFCIVWLLLTLLFFAAQGPGRRCIAVWSGITLFLPWIVLKNYAVLTSWNMPHWISYGTFGICLTAFLAVMVLWQPEHQLALERTQRFMTTVLRFSAVYGLLVLSQLLWFGWAARSLNTALPLHTANPVSAQGKGIRPRVIWILFDELSYQQVYEQRFHGLELPAFDRLATESAVFTHVVPAGIMTEVVLPSLMTGVPVDKIRSSADGQHLSLHNPELNRWQQFDQHSTVFQDALNKGYRTGIAGWYNPYCRILPQVLDQCFWRFDSVASNRMLSYGSVVVNALQPFMIGPMLKDRLPSKLFGIPESELSSSLHISDYQTIFTAADHLIEDPSATFIFLHMPVPHPDGIYNRATGRFALRDSSYIDNLALADKYLAHVRSLLELQGQWDSSAVVIMGDHSWRTKLFWASSPDWTSEEQAASHGGQFDDRPGFIVKLPNQHTGGRIDTPFVAVNTRKLFDAITSNQIGSAETLSSWVAKLPQKH